MEDKPIMKDFLRDLADKGGELVKEASLATIMYADFERENEELRDRIKKILKTYGTTYTALTKDRPAVQAKFQRQLSKAGVSYDVILVVIKSFPKVSAYWLLTGEGEMFDNDSRIVVNTTKNNNSGNQIIGEGNIEQNSESALLKTLIEQNAKLQDYILELSKLVSNSRQ